LRLPRLQDAVDVAGDLVDLEVHARARRQPPERGDLDGMRNQVDGDDGAGGLVAHPVDGEADAIDRHRSLVGEEAGQRVGYADLEQLRFADRLEAGDFPEAVDVSRD